MSISINARTNEIMVFDEITPDSTLNFDRDLKALGPVRNLTVRINSPGGAVFQGSAIYQMLARHPAHKTVYIDGVAASMASMIAMAGDKIIMAENAMMMIHNPSAVAEGGRADMQRMDSILKGITEQMASTYAKRTGLPVKKIEAMMAAETWLTASEAVAVGFADSVEGSMKIAALHEMARFDMSGFKHAPAPKTISEMATAYWAARNGTASNSGPLPKTDSLAPDLVTSELDHEAIFAKWNRLSPATRALRGMK